MKNLPTKKKIKDFIRFTKGTYGNDGKAIKRCTILNFAIGTADLEKFNKIFYKCLEEINRAEFS